MIKAKCVVPECVNRRWKDACLCTAHYHRLSNDERKQWIAHLFVIAAAAVAGDNDGMNDAVDDAWRFLDDVVPKLSGRGERIVEPSSVAPPSGR